MLAKFSLSRSQDRLRVYIDVKIVFGSITKLLPLLFVRRPTLTDKMYDYCLLMTILYLTLKELVAICPIHLRMQALQTLRWFLKNRQWVTLFKI